MKPAPFVSVLSLALLLFGADAHSACIGGKWDRSRAWVSDCTPTDAFDSRFPRSEPSATVKGSESVQVGPLVRTLSWKLHFWRSDLAPRVPDSLPLLLGLHAWQDNGVDRILDSESSVWGAEGSWESVLVLTVALETGHNLGTWWWGGKVGGQPQPWAEEAILGLLKRRMADACSLLADAGAASLRRSAVDTNRVYLYGHSMGGAGTYRMGIKHPEIFAAVHAHAGFADFKGGPCGNDNFCLSFDSSLVGSARQGLKTRGLDGKAYPARDYTDMSWFAGTHRGASWTASLGKGRRFEPPYVFMTHGKKDPAVNIASADRLRAALERSRFGFSFYRTAGGHSDARMVRWAWLSGFRKDLSYPAFNRNSADTAGEADWINRLDRMGWLPGSVRDEADGWSADLEGRGIADVTLRRLQRFAPVPGGSYRFWVGERAGPGRAADCDSSGALTLPEVRVRGRTRVTVEPYPASPPPAR